MMEQYRSNSYLFGGNAPYVEELYEAYLDNPGSVPDSWRSYFDALQHVPAIDGSQARDVPHAPVVESFAQRAKANAFGLKVSSDDIVYSSLFTGVHGNYLKASIRAAGLDPDRLPEGDKSQMDMGTARKAWKDIWGSGQGIGAVKAVVPAGELVARLRREYVDARQRLPLG